MAIGMGHMLGFAFLENFRYPYTASSIRVFWQRWHISLSTWFKEYVYIPLGGNRKGRWRTGLNRLLVFFLTGLWHGAQWTFVVWGLGHGLLLMLETYGILPVDKLKPRFRWLGNVYVLTATVCLFVFFRSVSFAQALCILKSMFVAWHITVAQQTLMAKLLTPHALFVFIAAVIGSASWVKKAEERLKNWPRLNTYLSGAGYAMTLALLGVCIASLTASSHNPFIYFRF
jgi:alginate O-acetyltransferase complex protein AlgI